MTYLSTLQLGLEPSIKKHFTKAFEDFTPLEDQAILKEQHRLISALNPQTPIIFRSNHASNALPLKGTLPKDKDRLLVELDHALSVGQSALVPKAFRGF